MASVSTGAAGLHPSIGLMVNVKASFFGKAWAKENFGDKWETETLVGHIEVHKPGRGKTPARWQVKFDFDGSVYWWTLEVLVGHGAPRRLLVGDEEDAAGGAAGGAAEARADPEQDLRTPQSKRRGTGGDAVEDAPRVRRAVRPPARLVESDEEEEDDEEEQSDEGDKPESEEETESEEEARQSAPVSRKGKEKVPVEREPMKKRAAKAKARKRVPRQLLDGASSGEEEFSDDEQLEDEGDPLETAGEAAAPSSSAALQWEAVEEGDDCAFIQPPEWKGGRSRVVRGVIGSLSLLNPFQIFLLLIPLERFWEGTVEQTNLYAEVSRGDAGPTEKGKQRGWTPVTLQELLKWVGIVLSMALHPPPQLSDYWRSGRIGNVTFPDTSRTGMSQNRFEQIKRYLHLNDNSQRPADRSTRKYRLWQLLPLLDTINDTFKKFYRLGQYVTFDERTIPIRNRACPVRVYNPKKPHKFGVEVFAAVDAVTFYCWHQHVYDKIKCQDLHAKMVDILADTLPRDLGHVCILDRGFTAPVVLQSLKAKGFSGTGTCVTNRKQFPAHMLKLDKEAERGTVVAAVEREQGMVAFAWKDRQPVFFVSTSHCLLMGETDRRLGAAVDQIPCPEAAYVYNKYKDGVDQFDKACLSQHYSAEMEVVSRKWWIRVFLGLLDSAFSNAYILFKEEHPEVSRFEFMLTLQQQLVENTQDNRLSGRGSGGGASNSSQHFCEKTEGNKRRRCRLCALKNMGVEKEGSRTRYYCYACNVPLCFGDCFKEWHNTERLEGRDFGAKRKRIPK
ncbi:hypothetical protein KFL_006920015 [Klebsormidium nitens]|uniref:PiggyBac transposable element-derived protein domain-containing protein n=1 Tax=Klebsormidium nitens TaxID=105231 RepID=A0A1Y1IQE5_KLENI|nr:hypothetical protein KFL_006920015 [Klebsormidium nitens]|eukprot:GAQ90847.1 hypothetical protein KFL_006920015 [Klebsormidium nitens]